MYYQIEMSSLTGIRHQKQQTRNQDAVGVYQRGNVFAGCIADGAGSCNYGGAGAERMACKLPLMLSEEFVRLKNLQDAQIRHRIMQFVGEQLTALAEEYRIMNIHDFASTLLLITADGNQCMIGHLGDGTVIGFKDERWCVLSFPENGTSRNATWLTSSSNAEQHLRIYRMNAMEYDGFLLMTDGMMDALFRRYFEQKHKGTIFQALQTVQQQEDDASFLCCRWR